MTFAILLKQLKVFQMSEKPIGIVLPSWNPNEPRYIVADATEHLSDDRKFANGKCVKNQRLKIVFSVSDIVDGFNAYNEEIDRLKSENEQLRKQIKKLQIENEAQSDAIDGLQGLMAHLDLDEAME